MDCASNEVVNSHQSCDQHVHGLVVDGVQAGALLLDSIALLAGLTIGTALAPRTDAIAVYD